MLKTNSLYRSRQSTSPDYPGLARFLIQPFLESPESLSIDCEPANNQQRIWIRVAFEGEDKGRVFGRGGRNLQAIRTVLSTAATAVGQSVYLDIYEGESHQERQRYTTRTALPRKLMDRKYLKP